MTGEWTFIKARDVHVCAKPYYKKDAPTNVTFGDRWKCDECKKVWEVKGFDSGMQHDPYEHTVIRWEVLINGKA